VLHLASDSIITTGPRPTPGPWAHAYEHNETETLCGLPLTRLHWDHFLLWPFQAAYPQMRCSLCDELADLRWVEAPPKKPQR
jgi:hypothetical protein